MTNKIISEKVLVLASSNSGKIKEYRRFLAHLPIKLEVQPDNVQVEETGDTFLENARLKAFYVASLTGKITLADDSGLCVNALNGAPGVYSARYANTDEDRINRLLKEMEFIQDRTAYFIANLCVVTPDKQILLEVEGKCDGVITESPRGYNGFGYDPIFELISTGLTFAEMQKEQKQILGHRGIAFKLLESKLEQIFL